MSFTESSAASPAKRGLVAIALLALFAAAFALFTQDNRYPFFYHPDEYGKAKQIVDGTRSYNFNHPLLLLNVARPLKSLWPKKADDTKPVKLQNATEAGRTASAVFAALAVVALALAGYLLAGLAGGIGAAAVALFHPMLFEHAHIFKEDTALTMGLAVTVLATVLFWKKPASGKRAAFLGVAVALAVSGKYVGLTAFAIALPVAIFAPGEKRGRRLGLFAAGFVAAFVLCNFQIFTHMSLWRESFNREVGYTLKGQHGLLAQDSVTYYQQWFGTTVSKTAVFFLALNAFNLVTTARRRSLADWLIFLFPFAFTAMLMASPRVSDRYFLPAAVLFNFNALVGVGLSAEWFTRAFGKFRCAGQFAFTALALFVGWSGQFSKYGAVKAQFKVDDRRELETWMNDHLPAGSSVVQDYAIHLPDATDHKQDDLNRPFKHTVRGHEFVAELGTLAELRAQGVRYVATSPKKSQRYTDGGMMPSDGVKEEFERRKAFYSALPREAKLLKKWDMAEIDTLHPGIELYDLSQKP